LSLYSVVKAGSPLNVHDWRRIPFASQRFRLRSIEAHAEVEGPLGSGEASWPRFLHLGSRSGNKGRADPSGLHWNGIQLLTAKTVQAVSDLVAFLVVECDRPESVRRWDGRFVEVDRGGKRRDLVACLDLVNCIVVRRAVRLRTANDPNVRSWGINALGCLSGAGIPR